jgi:hypothetical protein
MLTGPKKEENKKRRRRKRKKRKKKEEEEEEKNRQHNCSESLLQCNMPNQLHVSVLYLGHNQAYI